MRIKSPEKKKKLPYNWQEAFLHTAKFNVLKAKFITFDTIYKSYSLGNIPNCKWFNNLILTFCDNYFGASMLRIIKQLNKYLNGM